MNKGRVQIGEEALQKFLRQALHAAGLRFFLPRIGNLKKFKSKLPKDMAKLAKGLRDEAV